MESTALGEFFELLKRYKTLAAWSLGGVFPPFVAQFAKVLPPWPDGLALMTAVVEVIALIIAFQFVYRAGRRFASKFLIISTAMLIVFATTFISTSSFLVYEAGPHKTRSVKGFICREYIQKKYEEDCPFLDEDILKEFEFDAKKVWIPWTVDVARILLCLNWMLCFISLSSIVGSFIVFQSGQKVRAMAKPNN